MSKYKKKKTASWAVILVLVVAAAIIFTSAGSLFFNFADSGLPSDDSGGNTDTPPSGDNGTGGSGSTDTDDGNGSGGNTDPGGSGSGGNTGGNTGTGDDTTAEHEHPTVTASYALNNEAHQTIAVCTICSYEQVTGTVVHSFYSSYNALGQCEDCGWVCNHNYETISLSGACSVCKHYCVRHEWESDNRYCKRCNYICSYNCEEFVYFPVNATQHMKFSLYDCQLQLGGWDLVYYTDLAAVAGRDTRRMIYPADLSSKGDTLTYVDFRNYAAGQALSSDAFAELLSSSDIYGGKNGLTLALRGGASVAGYRYVVTETGTAGISLINLGQYTNVSTDAIGTGFAVYLNGTKIFPLDAEWYTLSSLNANEAEAFNAAASSALSSVNLTAGDEIEILCNRSKGDISLGAGILAYATVTYESGATATFSGNFPTDITNNCTYSVQDHTIVNGSCSVCGYSCQHKNSTLKSVSAAAGDVHDVLSFCADCGIDYTKSAACTYTDSLCTVCGDACAHANTIIEYTSLNATQHTKTETCKACGMAESEKLNHAIAGGSCATCGYVCAHSYADGICTVCGTACSHTFNQYGMCSICLYTCRHVDAEARYYSYNNGTHNYSMICTTCGGYIDKGGTQSCSYSDGICTFCGYACGHVFEDTYLAVSGGHVSGKKCTICSYSYATSSTPSSHTYDSWLSYISSSDSIHSGQVACSACGNAVWRSEPHSYESGVCSLCSHSCSHASTEFKYVSNNDGTHDSARVCSDCDFIFEHSPYSCNYDDAGVCINCGYTSDEDDE